MIPGKLHSVVWAPVLCVVLFGFSGEVGGVRSSPSRPVGSAYREAAQIAVPQELSERGKAQLLEIIASATLPDLRWPDFRKYQHQLEKFYRSSGYTLPWVSGWRPTAQARALLVAFQQAESKGLDPRDYDGPQWDERVANLEKASVPPEAEAVRFDLALTISAMRYVSDLHQGRANPLRIPFSIEADNKKYDLAGFLLKNLALSPDVDAVLDTLEPSLPGYQRELAALKHYLDFARQDSGKRLHVPRHAVPPNGHYAGIRRLAELLRLLEDLPSSAQIAPDDTVYQGALVAAVKHFQSRNGLEVDGRLGPRTIQALNVPLAQRVVQLELALERWRWLPHQLASPPVIVNIPQFVLHAYDEQHWQVLSMKVVVGEAYKHETPVLASKMRFVILRPAWEVPTRIALDEIFPEVEKNPAYLAEKNYEFADKSGKVVSLSSITPDTPEKFRSGELSLRQKPGPDNSLGLIKFEFPNPYGIYLHDTPATELFSRSRRDFSHGCIRVEDPIALAAWLLRDNPGWDIGRIVEEMNGDETVRIRLARGTPLLILYSTAVVSEDGEIHFADDIYGDDADLEKSLANRQR